jgi:hypothetical protein
LIEADVLAMLSMKLATVRVGYAKRWFIVGSVACGAAIVLALALAFTAMEDFTVVFWLVVAWSITALLALFPLPCVFTHHIAGERSLRLHMGFIMKLDVPYSAVRKVSAGEIRRGILSVGIGVRYNDKTGTVFVVSSFDNIVSLELSEELRIRAWRPLVHHILFSVENAEETIELLSSKMTRVEG